MTPVLVVVSLIPRDLARARRYGARMLEMRPDCERCGVDLPADAGGAFICSLECTYCAACADDLDERCPGCGGELLDRPARVGATLKKYPAATERRHPG